MEATLFSLLDGCVSSSLSSPRSEHLLWGRVDVLCGPPCLRGAGQDRRHAFRDALFHGVSSQSVTAVPRWKAVKSQESGHLSTINRHLPTYTNQTGVYFSHWCRFNRLFCKRLHFGISGGSFIDLTSDTSRIKDGDQSVVLVSREWNKLDLFTILWLRSRIQPVCVPVCMCERARC